MNTRPYDLVVFGASSFVGDILCRYLALRVGTSVKWALAGRSREKLERQRDLLGRAMSALPILIADSHDEGALRTLCESTRVIISTVGPYALYGETLVRVCAETGTDYCDLTGEVQWIKRMIDRYEVRARETGARIVHCCGFDSIPSDLGVQFLQQQAAMTGDGPCERIRMGVKGARGGFSGGTVASLMNVVREASTDAALRRDLADPYLIAPAGPRCRQANVMIPEFDEGLANWVAPFVMAGINTRVVHRSHGLAGHPWGESFAYDETTMTGKGLAGRMAAYALAGGMGAFMAAAALPPARWMLERFVLPKPGEGPSPEAQETGYFDLRFHGTRADGSTITAKVTGDRDPGYGSTAKMLGESGLCLAFDRDKTVTSGGVWTPSVVMGDALRERLVAHAGLTFTLLP